MTEEVDQKGSAVDDVSYPRLELGRAALDKAPQGGEVTAADGHDQIVRCYPLDECRTAPKFRNKP